MIVNGKEMPIHVRYKNNKHTYFRIQEDGLHIHTSHGMPEDLIKNHIIQKFDMFYERYIQFNRLGKRFTLWGEPLHVHFKLGKPSYIIHEQTIDVEHYTYDEGIKYVLKTEMENYINSIHKDISKHLKKFHITQLNYIFKYYKSKFGAYHKVYDNIYLNTFLATQDKALTWYVLMHEYAHTKHFHHQKSFYELLELLHPNYKGIEKSLKSLVIPSDFHV